MFKRLNMSQATIGRHARNCRPAVHRPDDALGRQVPLAHHLEPHVHVLDVDLS